MAACAVRRYQTCNDLILQDFKDVDSSQPTGDYLLAEDDSDIHILKYIRTLKHTHHAR